MLFLRYSVFTSSTVPHKRRWADMNCWDSDETPDNEDKLNLGLFKFPLEFLLQFLLHRDSPSVEFFRISLLISPRGFPELLLEFLFEFSIGFISPTGISSETASQSCLIVLLWASPGVLPGFSSDSPVNS